MSDKVLLLYGYGPNVGASVVKKFAANGWKTAAIVRTLKDEYKNSADLVLQVADFADYNAIERVYNEVESKLGTPGCVVYNAYSNATQVPRAEDLFGAPPAAVAADLAVNTASFYTAAALASAGFRKLASGPRVFIFTGNGFPTNVTPEVPVLAAAKAASAYLIEAASHALGAAGLSHWYFADERLPGGKPIMGLISGDAHADAYYAMATADSQGPWNFTFVKGTGYQRFPDVHDHEYTTVPELLAHLPK